MAPSQWLKMTIKVANFKHCERSEFNCHCRKSRAHFACFFGNEIFLVIFNHNVQVDYSSTTSSIGAAILTYTFLKYTLSLYTKVYLILGVCTKIYLKNLATFDVYTKVYLE